MEEGVGVTHVFHKCVTGSVFIISRISQVFIGACQYFCIWLQREKCNLLYTWRFLRCLRYIFKSRCLIFRGVNLLVASELVKFSPRQTEGSLYRTPSVHLPSSTSSVCTDGQASVRWCHNQIFSQRRVFNFYSNGPPLFALRAQRVF